MSNQFWKEALVVAQGDGAALATSTTITSLLSSTSRFTLYSGYFGQVGKKIRIKAHGRISTFTSGTLTFTMWLGTVASPIAVFVSQALTLVASQTNLTFELEIDLICRAVGNGTSATILGVGTFKSAAFSGNIALLPASAPAVGTGFDSTITNVLDLAATWSVSNAANSIQIHDYEVESVN